MSRNGRGVSFQRKTSILAGFPPSIRRDDMKRVLGALLFVALGLAGSARAQGLTMQMSNGWSFSFAGNVNAFLAYQHLDSTGAVGSPGTAVGTAPTGTSRIRTGLLPAFATFDRSEEHTSELQSLRHLVCR